MRALLFLVAALLAASCRCGGTALEPTPPQDLEVRPTSLEFGDVYVGATRRLTLAVVNRGRAARRLTLSASPPLHLAPETLALGGGGEVALDVEFSPVEAGAFQATLRVDATDVVVRGTGLAPGTCETTACRSATFDPELGRCVEAVHPDGSDCAPSYACFVRATCSAGDCVGTLTTCDDANPCTLDVCGETGCGSVDDLLACPSPVDPCQAAVCDPRSGCGVAPVPDGTPCGARDCATARVCITGACVTRQVPQTQGCVEVVAGRPGGLGFADGVGSTARFGRNLRIAADATGTIWVSDRDNNLLRRVSPSGVVTSVAGQVGSWAVADGFGMAANFLNAGDLAVTQAGVVVLHDTALLRRASRAGQVVTWVGDRSLSSYPAVRDGIGGAATVGYGPALATAPGGVVWLVDSENVVHHVLRRVSPTGEVRTVASLGGTVNQEVDLTWVAGELWYAAEAEGVSRVLGDGGLALVAGPGVRRLSASPTGEVALASLRTLRVLRTDGGVLQHDFTAPDVIIMDVTALPAGGWALALGGGALGGPGSAESSRLAVLEDDGGLRFLAGSDWPLPLQDGPVATAGLESPRGLAVDEAGGIYVYEYERLRLISGGRVTTLRAVPDAYGNSDLARLSSGALVATTARGVELFDGADAGLLLWSGGANGVDALGTTVGVAGGGSWVAAADAGVTFGGLTPGTDLVLDGLGGAFYFSGARVTHVDAQGATTDLAGGVTVGDVDGQGAAARFGLSWGLARSASGTLFVADGTNRSVRRISPTGAVTTVVRLADQPWRVLVEDGGTLLVTVPNAVLRVRP